MKDEGSYALIFIVTFVLVAALTVVTAKLFDTTPALPSGTTSASPNPPFPDAFPQLPPPRNDPRLQPKCASYCTSETTGKLDLCATTTLTPCSTDAECSACREKQPFLDLTCQQPGAQYPDVPAQQASMNNQAAKYCLPTKQECLKLPEDKPLQECRSNTDCLRCTDTLPNGATFVCEPRDRGERVELPDKSVTVAETGQYCVPASRGCNPKYGTATWTSDGGWTCRCKYPDIFGGPECDELVACSARDVAPWAKSKQQLLLNMPGADGSAVGEPWTAESQVDPTLCISAEGKQVSCEGSPGLQRTVACQCDGVQKTTFHTYTYDREKPLSCKLDPCNVPLIGGKTWLWDATPGTQKEQLYPIPGVTTGTTPPCSCSGYGSAAWAFDPKAQTSESMSFTWQGYCKDVQIPNSTIVLPATKSADVCAKEAQPNTGAADTELIPSVNQRGESICTRDPCAGLYSDSSYRTNTYGHFDHVAGKCYCSKELGATEITLPAGTCKPVENPICSTCVSACKDLDPEDPRSLLRNCPIREGDACSLSQMSCGTDQGGNKVCNCGPSCFWYNGECRRKVPAHGCCEGLQHVPGVCEDAGLECRLVRSASDTGSLFGVGQQDTDNLNFHDQAFVCLSRDNCGHEPLLAFWSQRPDCKFPAGCGVTNKGARRQ